MSRVWNEQTAVIVLRVDKPRRLPEGIFSDNSAIMFLKDGAFLLHGGVFEKEDEDQALNAIADAFPYGHEPLDFHRDSRGIRFAKLGNFIDHLAKKVEVPGYGSFSALELDYESALAGEGFWVSVADVYERTEARRDSDDEDGLEDAAVEPGEPDPDIVTNVVVVLEPPERMPRQVQVLGTMKDGTQFVVGPKSRSWIDALKEDPGPTWLRLIRGPVSLERLIEYEEFERLDLAMRAMGTPMLVMPG